jgi:O-antigen/teichoic acid export membrane protein
MVTGISLKRQFASGVAAEVYSQVTAIASQLILLPIMIWQWGPERYGAWLLIASVSAVMALANLGFSQTASVEMAMMLGNRDRAGARSANQTLWVMTLVAALVAPPILAGVAMTLPWVGGENVPPAVLVLSVSAAIALLFGAAGAGMKATGHFALMVTGAATMRAADAVVLVCGALAGLSFVEIALLSLLVQALTAAPFVLVFYRHEPWLIPGREGASLAHIRRLFLPSLSYLSYALGSLLSIQGVALLVGAVLGPGAVTVVSAIRTLTRLGRTASVAINHSLEPILAQMAGEEGGPREARILTAQTSSMVALVALYLVGMLSLGPAFLQWWTHGVVSGHETLFVLMTLAVVLEMAWYTIQTPLLARNRHVLPANFGLVVSALTIPLTFVLMQAFGLVGVGIGVVVGNAAIAMGSVVLARRQNKPTRATRRKRVMILDTHPVQYRAPIYAEIARNPLIDLLVVYYSDFSVRGYRDAEFGAEVRWNTPLLDGYSHCVLDREHVGETGFWAFTKGDAGAILTAFEPELMIVHSLDYAISFRFLLRAQLRGVRLWLRVETQDKATPGRGVAKSALRFVAYRTLYPLFERAFSFGHLSRAHLLRHGFSPKRLSHTGFSTVDRSGGLMLAEKTARRCALRRALGIGEGQLVIGYFGKLIALKMPEMVLSAADELARLSGRKVTCLFVGSGERLPQLQAQAAVSANSDAVFTGFVNQAEIGGYYLACDIVVLPSVSEVWGLVVNEALQAGCAVAMSDGVGAAREFGPLERCGVFPVGDVGALTSLLEHLACFERDFEWAQPIMRSYSTEAAARAIVDAVGELP